jgi:23S rRNA pseudouridine2605 synthase
MTNPRKPSKSRKTAPPRKPAGFSPRRPAAFKAKPEPGANEQWPMRLNKYIAHCGICSRRQAAELVKEGQVIVNGEVVTEPGVEVSLTDIVTYKGQNVRPEDRKVYILMNKPKNVITTSDDERGRTTVLDLLKGKVKERIYPVGRLDRDTTGLILLTNDGDLAQKLAHPRNSVVKVYKVGLDKSLSLNHMEAISAGLELEDGKAEVDNVYFIEGKKSEIGIEIHTGKNRIVRRIFEHLGYNVLTLDRIFYAGLTKKDLPRGFFRRLTEREVIQLKHFS